MNVSSYISRLSNLFLFLLPWQTMFIYYEPVINGAKWQYGTLGFYATELIAWAIVCLFLLQYIGIVKSNAFVIDKKFGKDRLFVACFLLFVVFIFLTSFFAPVAEVARQHALRMTLAFLLFIIFSSQYISFARAQYWLIAGSIIPSMLGIWQFLSQSTIGGSVFGLALHQAAEAGTSVVVFGDERWLRAYGTMSHPNVFGGYLAIVLCVIFFYGSKKLKVKSEKRGNVETCIVLVAAVLASVALVFTFSRSAWIAFVVLILGTGYWFIKQKIGVRYHLIILVPMAVCALLFLPVTKTRLLADSAQEQRTIEERVESVAGVKDVFFSSPWIGTGAGNYTARMHELHPGLPGWKHQPVHAVPLLILSEVGIAGTLILGVYMYFFYRLFRSVLVKQKILFVTGILFLVPLLIFDHYLYSSYVGLVLLALLITSFVRSEK